MSTFKLECFDYCAHGHFSYSPLFTAHKDILDSALFTAHINIVALALLIKVHMEILASARGYIAY